MVHKKYSLFRITNPRAFTTCSHGFGLGSRTPTGYPRTLTPVPPTPGLRLHEMCSSENPRDQNYRKRKIPWAFNPKNNHHQLCQQIKVFSEIYSKLERQTLMKNATKV